MPRPASPSGFNILPAQLDELQTAADTLKLSVNAAVIAAGNSLIGVLKEGWRPEQLPKASSDHLLVFRIDPKTKTAFKKAAKAAGMGFSDFGRISALGALWAMAGKEQVLWPLRMKAKDFAKALAVYDR